MLYAIVKGVLIVYYSHCLSVVASLNKNCTRYLLQWITQLLYMLQEEAQRHRYPSLKLPSSAAALSSSVQVSVVATIDGHLHWDQRLAIAGYNEIIAAPIAGVPAVLFGHGAIDDTRENITEFWRPSLRPYCLTCRAQERMQTVSSLILYLLDPIPALWILCCNLSYAF